MYESPASLQEYCVEFVCENISLICDRQSNNSISKISDESAYGYVFRNPDAFFHTEISQQLLEILSEKGHLNDQILTLFGSRVTRLRKVRILNAGNITTRGLRVLRSHKITELEVNGLSKVTVNDLIGCLGDWTLHNLRLLNVSNSTFTNSGKFCVVVALSKLRNLQTLNVSNTEFNSHGLEIITEDLPLLENLDISSTRVKDITPLRKCKDRLKSLNLYNLKIVNCDEVVPLLCDLYQLRYLDLSEDKDHPLELFSPLRYKISDLLSKPFCLPHLYSLDISGKDNIDIDDLKTFLQLHPNLKFLGLVLTEACFDDMFTKESDPLYNPNLVVTGSATEKQILESLQRYPLRPFYIQKSLYYLYNQTQNFSEPRLDIIQLVLPVMQRHSKVLVIQMAATACLYNLSKSNLGQQIHPKWLKQVVELTLNAMENFPTHQQLQKNTLLTLCSDRILQEVPFDRYRCARLVMDSLVCFDDPSMNRMSVAICSILAAKISTTETTCLGASPPYMERLLNIVKIKTQTGEVDIMMKFTLSALWNLTDESPSTCSVFLSRGGMELFLKVLEKFTNESAVETKVLGLMNNIAEVAHLRKDLMKDEFLVILRSLLRSEHIDVSYFAAGIVAHLASDGPEVWAAAKISRKEMLKELGEVVLKWEVPENEMVAYRSFNPFFPLLTCFETYEVQLWAVWAIHHVCSKNPKRYCPMLIEEQGMVLLENVQKNPATHKAVVSICQNIIQVVELEGHLTGSLNDL